ncbi:hypothetical protein STEG23_005029 [Scotinomys teguina]
MLLSGRVLIALRIHCHRVGNVVLPRSLAVSMQCSGASKSIELAKCRTDRLTLDKQLIHRSFLNSREIADTIEKEKSVAIWRDAPSIPTSSQSFWDITAATCLLSSLKEQMPLRFPAMHDSRLPPPRFPFVSLELSQKDEYSGGCFFWCTPTTMESRSPTASWTLTSLEMGASMGNQVKSSYLEHKLQEIGMAGILYIINIGYGLVSLNVTDGEKTV